MVTTETVDMRSVADAMNQDLPDRPIVYWFASGRVFVDSGPYGAFYTGPGPGSDDG